MALAPGRAASPALRVKGRPKARVKARRREKDVKLGKDVKAAVARRGRLNNLDKLKSAVAAMTRHCRQQPPLRQVPRTTFSRM